MTGMFSVIQVEEPGGRAEMSLKTKVEEDIWWAKGNLISSGLRAPSSLTQQLFLIPSVSVAFLGKGKKHVGECKYSA